MNRYISAVTAIIILVAAISCLDDETDKVVNYVNIGDRVPEFVAEGVNGGSFDSKSFSGKRSLLVLFGTYCPDCHRELPVINRIYDSVKDNPDILIVGISREQERSVVQEYWESEGFSFPAYLDSDRSIFNKFANSTIPRIYIIDENGTIEWMAIEKLEIPETELLAKLL